MDKSPFIEHLREEKLKAQETRSTYTQKKLAYVTTLFGLGLGSISIAQFDLRLILYLVPFIATAFDLYILAEDYSVKRIGAFLGAHAADQVEKKWEAWVAENRDPFALVAMPILSTLLLAGAALTIWATSNRNVSAAFWVWLGAAGLPNWLLFVLYQRLRDRIPNRIEAD